MNHPKSLHVGKDKLKIFSDLLWSIAALVIMNGIIQIVIYPALNRKLGTSAYGDMLYLMSILSTFSAGLGMALNNGRLLRQRNEQAGNGDYLLIMVFMLIPSLAVIWIMSTKYVSFPHFLLLAALTGLMTLRYYSDAEYRLTLNYRRYFAYYAILSAGYILGLLLWNVLPAWQFVFILGEAACVLFCVFHGKIYHPLRCTSYRREVEKIILQLAPSYLLYNLVVQMDRIMLRTLMDSTAVTIYYVASLLGKVIALLVGPLNSILISYLTRASTKISVKTLFGLTCSFLAAGALMFGAICLVSPLVIRVLYPDIYDSVMEIAAWANLGQILCFSASLELTVLLTIAPAYWQMIIQAGYAICFFAGGYIGISLGGLRGFVFACLLANALRLIVTFVLLAIYSFLKGRKREIS